MPAPGAAAVIPSVPEFDQRADQKSLSAEVRAAMQSPDFRFPRHIEILLRLVDEDGALV